MGIKKEWRWLCPFLHKTFHTLSTLLDSDSCRYGGCFISINILYIGILYVQPAYVVSSSQEIAELEDSSTGHIENFVAMRVSHFVKFWNFLSTWWSMALLWSCEWIFFQIGQFLLELNQIEFPISMSVSVSNLRFWKWTKVQITGLYFGNFGLY